MQVGCYFGQALLATAGNSDEHGVSSGLLEDSGDSTHVIYCVLKKDQVHLMLSIINVIVKHLIFKDLDQFFRISNFLVKSLFMIRLQNHGKGEF
jgi:hypothetical protein